MSLRFNSLEQLANCSPHVKAQLERELGKVAPGPAPLEAAAARAYAGEPEPKNLLAKTAKIRGHQEEDVGRLLVEWIDLLVLPNGCRPGQFFYHVANGGGRSKAEAGVMKATGVRKGWPDYGLDLPAGRFHGFRLEIKREDGAKPTQDQLEILGRLESVGYKVAVAWGFEEACKHVDAYLDIYIRATTAAPEGRRPQAPGVPAHE